MHSRALMQCTRETITWNSCEEMVHRLKNHIETTYAFWNQLKWTQFLYVPNWRISIIEQEKKEKCNIFVSPRKWIHSIGNECGTSENVRECAWIYPQSIRSESKIGNALVFRHCAKPTQVELCKHSQTTVT